MEVILFSLILNAQHGFRCGPAHLIAKLFNLGVIKENKGKLPVKESYNEALDKLPVDIMQQMLTQSHQLEFKANGQLFHSLKVIIPDGTSISMSGTEETKEEYGEGQGHYVQSQALGFYDLSTNTFEDFKFEHCKTGERSIVQKHMKLNKTKTLYLADAGYNGMAFIAIGKEFSHELLMQLKSCVLGKNFLKTKKRSTIVTICLTNKHLSNYPDHQHLLGTFITVRMIRSRGTTKLRSQVLITTLLDEKEFTWQELDKLYRQRYAVELAFRHLKTTIRIEKIRKKKLQRIQQLMYAAIILFNLSAALRNRIKLPTLLPEKEGVKMYCFILCIELVHVLCIAAIHNQNGIKKKMNDCLKTIKGCYFIYKPWRAEPRICNTPPSEFASQRRAIKLKEIENAEFLKTEYEILKQCYGQRKEKNA